jgi:glycosyltransferase involved in cell wall biosynthesis
VLVLPSRSTPTWREQLGHVLLEAMAHGVAVVGSTCGAIPEVMGEAGLCFPEGDAAALTAAIQRFLDDPTLVARLGEAGRRRVETEFTNRILAARTREFHELVLSEQTRSRVLSSGGP